MKKAASKAPDFDSLVSTLRLTPVSQIKDHTGKVAGYGDASAIDRYFAKDPLYTAVHIINDAKDEPRQYGVEHTHPFPEVNVLAGAPNQLHYRIKIGDEERELASPAVIVIPAGVNHSANLVSGTGSFVVFRLMPEQIGSIDRQSTL